MKKKWRAEWMYVKGEQRKSWSLYWINKCKKRRTFQRWGLSKISNKNNGLIFLVWSCFFHLWTLVKSCLIYTSLISQNGKDNDITGSLAQPGLQSHCCGNCCLSKLSELSWTVVLCHPQAERSSGSPTVGQDSLESYFPWGP